MRNLITLYKNDEKENTASKAKAEDVKEEEPTEVTEEKDSNSDSDIDERFPDVKAEELE